MASEIGYLGPEGTYSHQAARMLCAGSELHPCRSIHEVIEGVRTGTLAKGVVPITNSVVGDIEETLSALKAAGPLRIETRQRMSIEIALMARSQVPLRDLKKLVSKDVIFTQCQTWLDANLRGVQREAVQSTAAAAQLAHASDGVAVLGPALLAEMYGLSILNTAVQDLSDNWTEFGIVSK